MAIQFITVRCPACGAELSIENGREFSFCSYCGSRVMINNENEHILRTIDEAGIRQAETDRMIRLRELELEEKEKNRGRKTMYIAYGIALAFVLGGALICIRSPLGGMWGFIIGVWIALFTFIKGEGNQKKAHRYVGPNEASVTEAMINFEERNFNSVVLLFRGAGFVNVTAVPLHDLNMFNMKKNGQVESVTINGNGEFEEGDIFPKTANILITYHSK